MSKLPTDPLASALRFIPGHKHADPTIAKIMTTPWFRGAEVADIDGLVHIRNIPGRDRDLRVTPQKLYDWLAEKQKNNHLLLTNEPAVQRWADASQELIDLNKEVIHARSQHAKDVFGKKFNVARAQKQAIEDLHGADALWSAAEELRNLRRVVPQAAPAAVTAVPVAAAAEAAPTGYRKINIVPHTTAGTPTDEVVGNVLAEIAEVSTPVLEQRLAQKLDKLPGFYGPVADNIKKEIAAIKNEIKARNGAQFKGEPAPKQKRPSADDVAKAAAAQAEQLKGEFDLAHGGPVESPYQYGDARVIIASKGERVVPKKGGPSKQDIEDEKVLQNKVKNKLGSPKRYAEGGFIDKAEKLAADLRQQVSNATAKPAPRQVPTTAPAQGEETSDDMVRRMTREARAKYPPLSYARGGIIGRIDAAAAKQKQQASKRI